MAGVAAMRRVRSFGAVRGRRAVAVRLESGCPLLREDLAVGRAAAHGLQLGGCGRLLAHFGGA
eukprot:1565334-Prymnesium_polylepis.1